MNLRIALALLLAAVLAPALPASAADGERIDACDTSLVPTGTDGAEDEAGNGSANTSEAPVEDPNATEDGEAPADPAEEPEAGEAEEGDTAEDPVCATVEAAERALSPYVCQLYTIHGTEPKLTLHPVLGMVEPDPDRCIERVVRPSEPTTSFARI